MKRKAQWDQGGVRAFKLCEKLHNSLEVAKEIQEHPLIEKMLETTSVVLELKENAKIIEKYQDKIDEVAELLETPKNLDDLTMEERKELSEKRKTELMLKKDEFYLNSNLQEKKSKKNTKKGEQKESLIVKECAKVFDEKEVMAVFYKTTNSFGAHLLTFLEVPKLPSTNNAIEQTFGGVRTKLRRITGRQNNHSTIYNHGEYLVLGLNIESYEQLHERISGISYDDYCSERKKHKQVTSHLKFEAQLNKDAYKFFQGLESQWGSLNNL
jgi:hypothetical protein